MAGSQSISGRVALVTGASGGIGAAISRALAAAGAKVAVGYGRNLRAPFLLAQHVLRGMRERGFGRILFISSVAALRGGIVGPEYAASKAGLHGLTYFLASRVARDGVT